MSGSENTDPAKPEDRPGPDIFRALSCVGDTDKITMTAAQAAELAGVLEQRCGCCADGELTRMDVDMVNIYEDHILMGGEYPDGTGYDAEVRMLKNGVIEPASTRATGKGFTDPGGPVYEIDGARCDEAGFEGWSIYALDPEGGFDGPMESTYEYPRFDESQPGYAFVNGYFEAAAADRREAYGSTLVNAPAECEFNDDTTLRVTYDDGKVLSVAQDYDYFGGGAMDFGTDCAVFDLTRGELMTLDEVVALDRYEIIPAIHDGLIDNGWESEMFDGQLYAMEVEDFDFYISDPDTVTVVFDKYEIAYGAAGVFSVDLPRAK